MRDYQDQADDEVLAIATIEHGEAIQNIEEVVSTLGLDLTFIGPGDLATSMGHHGQADHPDVQTAIATLEEAILRSPVLLGGVAPTVEFCLKGLPGDNRHHTQPRFNILHLGTDLQGDGSRGQARRHKVKFFVGMRVGKIAKRHHAVRHQVRWAHS